MVANGTTEKVEMSYTEHGSEGHEMRKRITIKDEVYFSVLPSFRSKFEHRKCKMKVYKTIIKSMFRCRYKTWDHDPNEIWRQLTLKERCRHVRRIEGTGDTEI